MNTAQQQDSATVAQDYEGLIKNIDTGKWVTGWNEKRVTHTSDEKKALVFTDEGEAEGAIFHLNASFPACYTLFDNVTPITQQ